MHSLLTIRSHNLYGNILTGLCAFALGATWLFDATGVFVLIAAFLLLIFSSLSLAACLTSKRQTSDEMARAHEGISSGVAFKTLLLACGLLCCLNTLSSRVIPIAPACCLCIGFGLVTYGLTFAILERE